MSDTQDCCTVWSYEKDLLSSLQTLSDIEHQAAQTFTNQVRKNQFLLGRIAANLALRKLGLEKPPGLIAADDGRPLWPDGYCVSISHCSVFDSAGKKGDSVAVAVAGNSSKVRSVGIDVEHSLRPLKEKTYQAVGFNQEKQWLEEGDTQLRTLMLLAAKECLYKMLYPLCLVYFSVKDAELTWDEHSQTFLAELKKDLNHEFKKGQRYVISVNIVDQMILATSNLKAI